MTQSIPDPQSFLAAVNGYVQGERRSSADRPNRLAVIDPAFSVASYPGTLPKVTFEGETALSGKRYAVLGNYIPVPSDRVVMVPVGNTYVILGPVALPASNLATLENSWVNYSATETSGDFRYARYWKDANGIIHLEGLVKDGVVTAGTTVLTLPVGFRPAGTLLFLTPASGPAFARTDVRANGQVTTNTGWSSSYTSLSGISFRAAL